MKKLIITAVLAVGMSASALADPPIPQELADQLAYEQWLSSVVCSTQPDSDVNWVVQLVALLSFLI